MNMKKNKKESWILFHFDKKQRRNLLNTILKNINSTEFVKSNDNLHTIEDILNGISETKLTFSDIFPYSEKNENDQVVLDTYIDIIEGGQKSLLVFKSHYMTSTQMKVLETIGQYYSNSSILIFSIERNPCGRVLITEIHVIENENGKVKSYNLNSHWYKSRYCHQIIYMDTTFEYKQQYEQLDLFKEVLKRGKVNPTLLKELNTSIPDLNRRIKQTKTNLSLLNIQMDSYVMCKSHTGGQKEEVGKWSYKTQRYETDCV